MNQLHSFSTVFSSASKSKGAASAAHESRKVSCATLFAAARSHKVPVALAGLLVVLFAWAAGAQAQTAPAYVVSSQAPLSPSSAGFGAGRANFAVNSRGDFFVNDGNNNVLEYPATGGGPIVLFTDNEAAGAGGVSVDPFDNLYVVNFTYDGGQGSNDVISQIFEFPFTNGSYPPSFVFNLGSPPGSCNPYEPATATTLAVPANTSVCTVGQYINAAYYYWQATGIAADGQGNTYMYSDYDNTYGSTSHGIFKCDLICNEQGLGGSATTYTSKLSTSISSIIADYAGNVYFVDAVNVNLVAAGSPPTGNVPTIVDSSYNNPYGITLDQSGNMYVTDYTGIWEVPAVETTGGAPCKGGADVCTIETAKKYLILKLSDTPSGFYGGVVGGAVDNHGNIVFSPYYAGVSEASLWAGNFQSAQVGSTGSSGVNFTILFDQATTLGGLKAVQDSLPATEFTIVPGTCTVGTAYTAGSTCTFSANFSPLGIGTRNGAILISDNNGNTTTTRLTGVGTGSGVAVDPGTPNQIGSGFKTPTGIAVDGAGNVYVTDSTANTASEYPAGGGSPISIGTALSVPTGVAVDGAGDVYIVNQGTGNTATVGTGTVVEIPNVNGALSNSGQTTLYTGLNTPTDIVSDGDGNLYITATGTNQILQLANANRAAGSGALIPLGYGLSGPTGIALDANNNVYVADTGNNRVLEIGDGFQTVVGNGLSAPTGVAVDPSGSVLIADGTGRLIRVPNETYVAPGSKTSAAGLNQADQEVLSSPLSYPYDLVVDNTGNLYVTDNVESLVFQLERTTGAVSFGDWNLNTVSDTQLLVVSNIGNTNIKLGSPLFAPVPASTEFSVTAGSGSLGCASGLFPSGYNCTLDATFAPTVLGKSTYPLVLNASSETNATPTIDLVGTGVDADAATIVLEQIAPTGAISYGQEITIGAKIAPAGNTPTPTGFVVFTFDGQQQREKPVTSGLAQISFDGVNAGVHTISAYYTGDSNYASLDASPLTITISQATSTNVLTIVGDSAVPLSVAPGHTVTFTDTLTPATVGLFTGSVTFFDLVSNTALYTQKLGAADPKTGNYIASYTFTPPAPLPQGVSSLSYNIVAQYSGNSNYFANNSADVPFLEIPSGYTITANSSTSVTASANNPGVINLTVTDYSSFEAGVALTCTGLPANAYCVFRPASAQLLPAAEIVPNTIYPVPITLQIQVDQNITIVEGSFVWVGTLLLIVLVIQRRRLGWRGVKLTCVVAFLSLATIASLSGCGSSGSAFPTPPGTYAVVITGTATPLTSGGNEPPCDQQVCTAPFPTPNPSVNVIETLNATLTVK